MKNCKTVVSRFWVEDCFQQVFHLRLLSTTATTAAGVPVVALPRPRRPPPACAGQCRRVDHGLRRGRARPREGAGMLLLCVRDAGRGCGYLYLGLLLVL